MKNILITGGCGFIGSNLIPLLLGRGGYRIRVLDNEKLGKIEHLEGADVDFIRGDLRDADLMHKIVKGMDAVVHLAADTRVMDSIADPTFNFENNVIGTMNVLLAMKAHGVNTFVNASTGGAILGEVPPPVHEEMLPKPAAPYGASKLAVEGYCSAFAVSYGMKTTSLRFSNVYGIRSYHKGSVVAAFFKRLLAGKPLQVYGDGSQIRDYVFVDDLCTGIVQAMESGKSGVFQLGTGIPVTINQLIDTMREVVGRPIEVEYHDFRQGELLHTYCDISKARRELGYNPRTPLKDGLRRTWEWFVRRQADI